MPTMCIIVPQGHTCVSLYQHWESCKIISLQVRSKTRAPKSFAHNIAHNLVNSHLAPSIGINTLGAYIAIIFDMVPTHIPADAMGYFFFWMMCTHDAQVGDFLVVWDGQYQDEEHGVGASYFAMSLCQAGDLCGIGCLPHGAIRAVAEFAIFGKLSSVWVECIAMESILRHQSWVLDGCTGHHMVQRMLWVMHGVHLPLGR